MERVQKQSGESENFRRTAQAKFTSKSRENELANSPMMVAQRQKLQSLFGGAAQLKGPEEEPLQAKHPLGEEEFLPGKYGIQQHKGKDEETLQPKLEPIQRATSDEKKEEPLQGKFTSEPTAQRESQPAAKPNQTGLPDTLKSGIESLSGMSMDNVKVHYNSSQPAQLNALAYAQGTDIHVAPGQEQHLPHEAWHVVQQAQGRVKPTMQMKDGVPVNDDKGLEHEADVMGAKAVGGIGEAESGVTLAPIVSTGEVQQHQAECCCPMCSVQRKVTQNSDEPVQRAVANNGQPQQGSDSTIESALATIDSSAGNDTLDFGTDIAITGMGTRSAMQSEAGSEAMSVAAVGTKRYVEGSVPFGTAAKGTETGGKIERLGQRPSGVHSEQYFEYSGYGPSAVWCAIPNCFFCNGYLDSKGIKHQAMKASYKYPEMWIHPTAGWKVVKKMSNKHEPKTGTRIWTISGHGGSDGVYFNDAHEK